MPAVNATTNKACTNKENPSERTVPAVGGGANSRCVACAFMLCVMFELLDFSVHQLNRQAHTLHTRALQGVHGFDHGFVFDGAVCSNHHWPLGGLALQTAYIF